MSEFNPREHFEQKVGAETLAYMKIQEVHKNFMNEVVAYNEDLKAKDESLNPYFTREEITKVFNSGIIAFDVHSDGTPLIETEITGKNEFAPYSLGAGRGMFWLKGRLGEEKSRINDEEYVTFIIPVEGQPLLVRDSDLDSLFFETGIDISGPYDKRYDRYLRAVQEFGDDHEPYRLKPEELTAFIALLDDVVCQPDSTLENLYFKLGSQEDLATFLQQVSQLDTD